MKSIRVDTDTFDSITYYFIIVSIIFYLISMFYFRMFMGIILYYISSFNRFSHLAFTPLHDAIHVYFKYKRINNIPAYLASVQYFVSYSILEFTFITPDIQMIVN